MTKLEGSCIHQDEQNLLWHLGLHATLSSNNAMVTETLRNKTSKQKVIYIRIRVNLIQEYRKNATSKYNDKS